MREAAALFFYRARMQVAEPRRAAAVTRWTTRRYARRDTWRAARRPVFLPPASAAGRRWPHGCCRAVRVPPAAATIPHTMTETAGRAAASAAMQARPDMAAAVSCARGRR